MRQSELKHQSCYLSVKKRLIILIAIISLAILIDPSLNELAFARISFGEDCLPCHQAGMMVSTNATETIQLEQNDSFWLEVSASGGIRRDTELVWTNVSHNTYFSFTPDVVTDNGPKDLDSESGKITAIFEISGPNQEGNYIIRTFAASSQGTGGFVDVEVVVGAGGEIQRDPFEVFMEASDTVVPVALGSITMLGIILYTVKWSKITEGEH